MNIVVPRLFVDMDGTLAAFRKVTALEELYERGYFSGLRPQENVVTAIRRLARDPSVQVYVLSAVLFDSHYALDEKNAWLDRYLPELGQEQRIFVPCGESKALYISSHLCPEDILLDDYTVNLEDWRMHGGTGVKLLNGINHTRRSWDGARLSKARLPGQLADALLTVARGGMIRDDRPQDQLRTAAVQVMQEAARRSNAEIEI